MGKTIANFPGSTLFVVFEKPPKKRLKYINSCGFVFTKNNNSIEFIIKGNVEIYILFNIK